MRNPFKRQKNKAQRQEDNRREELIKAFYQVLVENCANAQDMKTRVEIVNEMINAEGAKRVKAYQDALGQELFNVLELKAQDGKGKEVEEKIIEFFRDEKIMVAQTMLQTWIVAMDAWIRRDMLLKHPKDLIVDFK